MNEFARLHSQHALDSIGKHFEFLPYEAYARNAGLIELIR
jgi:hypothetical protein